MLFACVVERKEEGGRDKGKEGVRHLNYSKKFPFSHWVVNFTEKQNKQTNNCYNVSGYLGLLRWQDIRIHSFCSPFHPPDTEGREGLINKNWLNNEICIHEYISIGFDFIFPLDL